MGIRHFLLVSALACTTAASAKPLIVQGQDFMPYCGSEGGKLGGAFTKITEIVCKKAGVECVFEVVPLNRSLKMLEAGESAIVLGISGTDERKKFANFPDPITSSGYTIFVRKGKAASYTKLEDFKGKTVAVYGPSATMSSAEKVHKDSGEIFKLEKESTTPEIPFKKLEGGRYGDDAGVYSVRPIGVYFAKKEKVAIEPVGFDIVKANHGFGISKKGVDEATMKALMNAFAEVIKSPEAKKILAHYDLTGYKN